MAAEVDDDALLYADVAECFPYTVEAFHQLPEETRVLLGQLAARLRMYPELAETSPANSPG